jgi:hypothetical protein
MSTSDLQKEYDRLKAENEALKQKANKPITMKVSEKGGVSLYNVGRFPATYYAEQWQKILAVKDEILAFIEVNKKSLNWKE